MCELKINSRVRVTDTMRNTILSGLLCAMSLQAILAQAPTSTIVPTELSKSPRVPTYLLYRHFLGWVNTLDNNATASGTTDMYKFAEPFAVPVRLTNQNIDLLRNEARALVDDLHRQDARAFEVITAYRSKAVEAAKFGQPLPPLPAEVHQLQQERTALLVQYFARMQQQLGPEVALRFDHYLTREFAPHTREQILRQPSSELHSAQSSLLLTEGQQ